MIRKQRRVAAKQAPEPDWTAQGLEHHRAGRLDQAATCYQQALALRPDQAEALHWRGVLAAQQGQSDLAVALLRRAAAQNPSNWSFLFNLAVALADRGERLEAIETYRRVLAIKPDHADAYCNLGVVYGEDGRLDEALDAYQEAARCKPDHAAAHANLGDALREQGKFAEAAAACRRAIALKPDFAAAYSNLGAALAKLGQAQEAIAACRRAAEINPRYAQAHFNLGVSLSEKGDFDAAVDALQRAVSIEPRYAKAHVSLGSALAEQGKFEEAAAAYRRAIALKPDLATARYNLGNILNEQGKLEEAAAAYQQATALKPDYARAFSNLGNVLKEQGKIAEALSAYQRAVTLDPSLAGAYSNLLYCLNFCAQPRATELFAHRGWRERFGRDASAPAFYDNAQEAWRPLRIGYVSPDFRQHSVAYFLEPLLNAHDPSAVEIFCYAEVKRPDAVTARLRRRATSWLSTIGMSDADLAQRVHADKIDILVDLVGHTAKNRLGVFALKPAPIQAAWLGYPNTSGLDAIDYRLVDAITDPVGSDGDCVESLIRLEGGFLCYAGPQNAPETWPPPCLTEEAITFGSFNNPAKLSPLTLDVWAQLLARLPQARLFLKGKPFSDATARALLLSRMERRGVAPQRIELMSWAASGSDHLSLYHRIDVALDPFPYNGATTTCEALWMGVPVVTLRGDRHRARVGASLLGQLGLTECVADSIEDYLTIAANLAADRARLAALRGNLRRRMQDSSLCDGCGFARKVEAAYRQMWLAWLQTRSGRELGCA